jgi:multisubunit Na+/H+ antiporter MnhB subunit
MVRHSWLGALLAGVVLLIVANYVPAQPYPLPTLETIVGWILVVVGLLLLFFGGIGPSGGWGYGRRW